MTRWSALTAVAVLVLPAAAMAGGKKIPPQLTQARYVALAYDTGDRFVDARSLIGSAELAPRDAEALDALRGLVSDWDRFVLTERVDEADIVIAVRTSRRAAFEIGGRIGQGDEDSARSARTQAPSLDAEVSSPGDIFTVYASSGGQPGMVLWRERRSGDDFPRASFERFKADVVKHATK
ncbi:MAG: hypothetical protein ABW221_26250 [Vicinamibacteria bacterium]